MSRSGRLFPDEGFRVSAGRVIGLTSIALGLYCLVVVVATGLTEFLVLDYVPHQALPALGFGVFALLAIRRQPFNNSVWVAAWSGLACGISAGAYSTSILVSVVTVGADFESFGALTPRDLPLVGGVTYAMLGFVLCGYGLLLSVGLLLFPDGRLPSRGWRWALWGSIIAPFGLVVALFHEFRPSSTTPFGSGSGDWTGLGRYSDELVGVVVLFSLICLASLVMRYRHSRGVERQQYRVIVFGAGVLIAVLAAVVLAPGPMVHDLSTSLRGSLQIGGTFLGIAAVMIAYAVAVARYRLYDIDIVINRTVVLVLLGGFITAVYALLVVGLGRLIGRNEGIVLPIIATGVVAVAFEPARQRAQRWANRVVYGRRATPYEVLSDLTRRLSASEEGKGLLSRTAKHLEDGTGADRATIWLGTEDDLRVGASSPVGPEPGHVPELANPDVFPVTHDGVTVGVFEVVKPRGTALSSAEKALVTDLAGSAGAVLGYQRLVDSLEHKARELAESRGRLVDAQDRERMRLERDLHDGAQQLIVALKVKISLARAMAGKHGATDLESLLGGLEGDAQGALDEVRALAKGIYPPVLQSDGLGMALSALAAGWTEEVSVSAGGIGRYDPDIEAAVYFEVSEALNNALKHAGGPVRIELVEADGVLRFSVTDSGPGFDVAAVDGGSGLQNLRDRADAVGGTLEIITSPGKGTTVTGAVPMDPVPV